MDDLSSTKHAAPRHLTNGSHALQNASGPLSEIDRNRLGPHTLEKRPPLPIPVGLGGMLKTTTESGEIGQFAAKPFQMPPRLHSMGRAGYSHNDYIIQNPQQTFQRPLGPPLVDDRKQLPSYARDATSEIISMYETTSQKSSGSPRVFEEPGYRSYSMTQASTSLYNLSNHRSYTSLRSQPELNLVQRPRSPFPYPARLKRLGFRPSSPILTNGGRAEHNRHARTERTSNMGHATSGNGPISSQGVLSSSCEGDLSLLIQSSFGNSTKELPLDLPSASRPYVPVRKMASSSLHEWTNPPESQLENASPPRSSYSLSSTTNSYNHRPPILAINAPSRPHTPSPLYYDYTEEFSVEDSHRRQNVQQKDFSAPHSTFKNTPHDAKMIGLESDILCRPTFYLSASGFNHQGLEPVSTVQKPPASEDDLGSNHCDHTERSTNVTQDILPLYLDRETQISSKEPHSTIRGPIKIMSNENRTVTGDVENDLLPGILKSDSKTSSLGEAIEKVENIVVGDDFNNEMASPFRISAYLPVFPKPPDESARTLSAETSTIESHGEQNTQPGSPQTARSSKSNVQKPSVAYLDENFRSTSLIQSYTPPPHERIDFIAASAPLQSFASPQQAGIRSSRFYSIDYGLTDLAQLITNFEAINGSFSLQDARAQSSKTASEPSGRTLSLPGSSRILSDSLTLSIPEKTKLFPGLDSRSVLNKYRSEDNLKISIPELKKICNPGRSVSHVGISGHRQGPGGLGYDLGALNRPISGQSLSHPDSPMLAPQPVSPARIMRLQDSVPQLMKALPPVPRDSSSTVSVKLSSKSSAKPILGSSLIEAKSLESTDTLLKQPSQIISSSMVSTHRIMDSIDYIDQRAVNPLSQNLKSVGSNGQRSVSPTSTRAWKSEEAHSWFGAHPSIRLPSFHARRPKTPRLPKFNLRVTRASNLSSEATVFGTKNSDQIQSNNINLKSPTNSFLSSPSISGILRRVGKQFGSSKWNATMEPVLNNDMHPPFTVLTSTRVNVSYGHDSESIMPMSSPNTMFPSSPAEDRSFFSDDSSQTPRHNSLRNRISNLRARIPTAYISRPAAPSNDGIGSREGVLSPAPSGSRSRIQLGDTDEDDYGMPLADAPQHGLKSKISLWFKEARAAIGRHGTLRNNDEVRCMPRL